MKIKQISRIAATLLASTPMVAGAAPGPANCACPSGRQWVEVGQSTESDKCGLQIVLLRIESHAFRKDQFVVYIKSNQIGLQLDGGKPLETTIVEDNTKLFPAKECGFLLVGAHRAPQKNLVALDWSYISPPSAR